MAKTKITTPPPHQRVEGVLFEAYTAWGAVTVLGMPFEHADRLWAIHVAIGESSLRPQWVVSDVETGAKVPGVLEASHELARASAIAVLDALGAQKLKEAAKKFAAGRKAPTNLMRRKGLTMPHTPALHIL